MNDISDFNQNLAADAAPLLCQVAGHSSMKDSKCLGMMSMKGGYVLKPVLKAKLGKREIDFYESLQKPQDAVSKELKAFVPRYFGTTKMWVNDQPVQWIVLSDACRGYVQPCIMDVKIGRQTWDPNATEEKRNNEKVKYAASKRDLAFCIPGFQVYDLSSGELKKYDSDYGKSLDGEGVREALRIFLQGNLALSRTLLIQLLAQLWNILRWFRYQTHYHIFGSSILLLYDAVKLREHLKMTIQSHNGVDRPTIGRQLSLRIPTGPLTPGFEIGKPKSPSSTSPPCQSPMGSLQDWHTMFDNVCKTHSLEHNYEKDLQSMKENYSVVLKDLLEDRGQSECWVNVKMIDFAHVFPASAIDRNYLEGLENLIGILEQFLVEADS